MKKNILFTSILLLLIAGCAAQAEKIMPYPFDTAVIESEIEGSTTGTMDTYIKGDNMATETHAETAGEEAQKIDTLYIDTGDMVTFIDLNTKTGMQSENPIYQKLKDMDNKEKIEYLTDIVLAVPEGENRDIYAVKTGEQEIAGQKCEQFTVTGLMEICIWNTIPVYSKTIFSDEMGTDVTMKAINIQTDIDIPDSKFEVPEDITLN
jgi:hypothetical protein